MTESLTPLERWKELAIIENARMKRRLIGRDDMHAYAHKPWPLEKLRKEIKRCLSRHGELSVGDLCSMIEQDAVHIDIGLKTMRERRTIVKTSFIEGQQLVPAAHAGRVRVLSGKGLRKTIFTFSQTILPMGVAIS